MSLTLAGGPLASHPAEGNYQIDGPKHRIMFQPVTRRLRAELAGVTVIDTVNARLLHETAIRPRLYVPLEDVRPDVLERTDTHSYCPFKGDASYRSVGIGDTVSADALWVYDEPLPAVPWLRGYAGVYEERFDRWLDEDEEVHGALPDPFHRVDVRRSSRHVRVSGAGPDGGRMVLAESRRPLVVSETGLADRFYLPREDVVAPLTRTDTVTVCPYKGRATYWSVPAGRDVAWSYDTPLDEASRLAGHVSFDGEGVEVAEVR